MCNSLRKENVQMIRDHIKENSICNFAQFTFKKSVHLTHEYYKCHHGANEQPKIKPYKLRTGWLLFVVPNLVQNIVSNQL